MPRIVKLIMPRRTLHTACMLCTGKERNGNDFGKRSSNSEKFSPENSIGRGPDLLEEETRHGATEYKQKSLRDLKSRRYQPWKKQPAIPDVEGEILFGLHPVQIALEQNKRTFNRLYLKANLKKDKGATQQIVQLAESKDIEIVLQSGKCLDALSRGRPNQGVCLDASKRKYDILSEEELQICLREEGSSHRLWLYLDQIQDPMNFGAIIRSSYYFGVEKIFAPKINSCRLSGTVNKASAGTMELMNLYALEQPEIFIQKIRENDWTILGTSAGDDTENVQRILDLENCQPSKNLLLLIGNEGKGLSSSLLHFCHHLVRISPRKSLHPLVDSLNVSVATGVLLHSLARYLKK